MRALLVASSLLLGAPAHAGGTVPLRGFIRGQDWMNLYESSNYANRERALFYMEGVADAMMAQDRHSMLCVPNNLSARTLGEVIHHFYISHPDWLNDQASVAIGVAVVLSFACPR